jgi:hypothetical protein
MRGPTRCAESLDGTDEQVELQGLAEVRRGIECSRVAIAGDRHHRDASQGGILGLLRMFDALVEDPAS